MRIAAISDIHGSYSELINAWGFLTSLGLTPPKSDIPILNAGDNVGYGDADNECVAFLSDRKNNIISVCGNYDRNVVKYPQKRSEFARKWGQDRPEKLEAIRDSSIAVSDETREWLADLPKSQYIEIGRVTCIVTHYRPGKTKFGLFDVSPDSEFAAIADEVRGHADIVITGHTHTPYVKMVGDVLFVNPGSLGRPLWVPTIAVIDVPNHGPITGEILECP